jgi:DNA-binding response OmpR family regulator
MRILVVEDDALVADALRRGLKDAGYAVDHVWNAEAADTALSAVVFDLAVLDIGLPGSSGLELLQRLRRRGNALPVLILTARDELSDRVTALDLGADDYLAKPFELPEVAARCRALIRRVHLKNSSILKLGRLELQLAHREATVDGLRIDISRREWSVLECLALSAGRLVTKEALLNGLTDWQNEITENAVEVYISRLRAKLGSVLTIRVIRGLGYRLEYQPEAE